MNKRPLRVLLVDDDEDYYVLVRDLLLEVQGQRYKLAWAASYEEGLQAMETGEQDVCLLDYYLGKKTGMDLLRKAVEIGYRAPIILLTGGGSRQVDQEAIRAGAADYLVKQQVDAVLLERAIRYAIERAQILEVMRRRSEEREQANARLEEANQQLKNTQAHLVQSEKMASLGQLVAGIAHEINNPLSFVVNNTFLVKDHLEQIIADQRGRLAPEALERLESFRLLVEDVYAGTQRVKELVVKLRTFSRLDEGKFKRVDVHESIDSVLLFLQHKIRGRIEVHKEYAADGELACYAGQLNQLLMNVIANAVEAIAGKGEIAISTRREKGFYSISVRDTGEGIPETIRQRVFEPFFTTKPVGEGTGLGLAITYGIVQAHKGEIEVHSREGEGTEFVVKLPLDLEERIEQCQQAAPHLKF